MLQVKAQIIIAIILILAIGYMVQRIRKRALELRYALIWLLLSAIVLILDLFPRLMNGLAGLMGIASPMNMLFFLGFCFTLLILFGLTVQISKMSEQIKCLTQELAMTRKALDERQKPQDESGAHEDAVPSEEA